MTQDSRLTTISLTATATLLVLLAIPLGPLPPLGPFFSPNSGFWTNAVTENPDDTTPNLDAEYLSESATIYYDDKGIPHIFAGNDKDLYFAQGFVTARDRLWQMEIQTHAAAGRLSEILGPSLLEYDRYQRRIGMGYGAEQALEGMKKDPETWEAVKAYTDGVNAWIQHLEPHQYPLEYKILNYRPERWTPLKCALLLKNMTYTLASGNSDLRMSNTRAYLGDSFIRKVLDLNPSLNDPIIPADTPWNFDPLTAQKPDTAFTPSIVSNIQAFKADPGNGSNNWAVSGNKTAGGYPILANDPHLNMTLPSIWYAIQLHSPSQNVMGVSLPGAPTVIVGFNEDAAWGTTNVGADVWDWYEIQFRDSTLSEYRYDGAWKETHQRIEKIGIKGKEAFMDTVIYTHHGPVVQSFGGEPLRPGVPASHAMRWIAHDTSNELKYFLKLNRAENYDDYQAALKHYQSPAQNWVFADSVNIALTVAGKYPLKWNEQGRFISDGSDPRYDWQGWIPFEQMPAVKNPERGFVSSANQDPAADSYPYYLDADFAPYERGRRINERLAAMDSITVEDMQDLQLDTYSYHARTVLPKLLQALHTDTLTTQAKEAYEQLAAWNYENNGRLIAPSAFKYWWDALDDAIWSDEYEATEAPLDRPARDQVADIILYKPNAPWYDNIDTEQKETLDMLINQSFAAAMDTLEKEVGSFGNKWKWGYVNNTNINHIAQIPGLGRKNLFTNGGGESINAIRGNHGPSWRMVVELGPEVKGYGLYPGGQSGNPGSKQYDNMVDDWNAGKLYPLWFIREEPTGSDSVAYTITLK